MNHRCAAALPTEPGVYVFYRDGRVCYVGSSVNLKRRIQYHGVTANGETAKGPIDACKVKTMKRWGSWLEAEARLIRRLRPSDCTARGLSAGSGHRVVKLPGWAWTSLDQDARKLSRPGRGRVTGQDLLRALLCDSDPALLQRWTVLRRTLGAENPDLPSGNQVAMVAKPREAVVGRLGVGSKP